MTKRVLFQVKAAEMELCENSMCHTSRRNAQLRNSWSLECRATSPNWKIPANLLRPYVQKSPTNIEEARALLAKTSTHVLSTLESTRPSLSWKTLEGVARVRFYSPHVTAVRSFHSCSDVGVCDDEVNHNRSQCVLDSDKSVCCHRTSS